MAANQASKVSGNKTPCPLFPRKEGEERQTFVEDIMEVRLHRVIHDPQGREKRAMLARKDWPLVIDSYSTTDQNIVDAYNGVNKPGLYYVEPIGHDGTKLMGAHNILVADPKEDEEDDDDDEEEEVAASPPQDERVYGLIEKMMSDKDSSFRSQLEQAENSHRRATELYTTFTEAMMRNSTDQNRMNGPSTEMIDVMREQIRSVQTKATADIEEISRRHRADSERYDRTLEEMRRGYREDLARREREAEDQRRTQREELTKKDQEIAEVRRRFTAEEDDQRRRARDESSVLRERYERDLTQARGDVIEVRNKLQTEIDRIKDRLEARVLDLEKESIRLQRDLAVSQTEQRAAEMAKQVAELARAEAEKEIDELEDRLSRQPSGAPGSEGTPWYAPLLASEAGQKIVNQVVGSVLSAGQGAPSGVPPVPQFQPQGWTPPVPMGPPPPMDFHGGPRAWNQGDPTPDPTPDPIPDPTPDPIPDPTPDPSRPATEIEAPPFVFPVPEQGAGKSEKAQKVNRTEKARASSG